jgi:hypothetical protein
VEDLIFSFHAVYYADKLVSCPILSISIIIGKIPYQQSGRKHIVKNIVGIGFMQDPISQFC